MVPEGIRPLYMLNPIARLLELYHQAVYDGVFPSAESLAIVTGMSLAVAIAGYAVFRRYARVYAELV